MFKEDTCGFINFPPPNGRFVYGKDIGKTLVYLVAFEPTTKIDSGLSNVNMEMQGHFVSDDMVNRHSSNLSSLDDLISEQIKEDEYDMYYFPNFNSEDELIRSKSINLITCVCIGWSNLTYELMGGKIWVAGFRDLTNEGQRLYYSVKKLHNNKEIRILTFNNI